MTVAVPAPLYSLYDYCLPTGLAAPRPGCRVRVPFGRRSLIAVTVAAARSAADPGDYRAITEVLDDTPLLPPDVLSLCCWAAEYYHHPVGEVIAAALPGPLRRGNALKPPRAAKKKVPAAETAPELNAEQARALQTLEATSAYACTLIEGVTGSGKTELYLRHAAKVLAAGKQVLVLVPEIGLTPQLAARFEARFGDRVALFHSGMTETARARSWLRARSGEAAVLIGTRSAVFLPLLQPGLIVVDEEHDPSFKQQEGFRYSARDLAVLRAQRADIPVLLGSATPSLESLHKARSGQYQHLRLTQRAQGQAPPRIGLLDVRGQPLSHGLSPQLLERVAAHTAAGGQALLFINRRGYAPVLMCHDCGWRAPCNHCDAHLTLHRGRGRLVCHHCGAQQPAPRICPSCGSQHLVPIGQGTERIEDALRNQFPALRVERFDSDRLRKAGELERLLADIRSGAIHILVGTQVLAKGHDFAGLSLVGIISADQALYGADFRAIERMGSLVTQVAGRAGRAGQPGEVLLQTHEPEHPLLQTLLRGGYPALCEALLKERAETGLPPFGHLALLRAEGPDPAKPLAFLKAAKAALPDGDVRAYDAVPAGMARRAGYHRAQLLLRANRRAALQSTLAPWVRQLAALPGARQVRWSLDVDPADLF